MPVENTERWKRIKELFEAALERDSADRAQFLGNTCAADASLRKEVESLLSAYARSDGLSLPVTSPSVQEAQPSRSIGPYRLIRMIGEGGMGQVWLAEQNEPLRRQVALKLIRPAALDSAVLRRFKSEQQSLALMDHPAIPKVFDAGATASGQPYFVMEYVPGEPITTYCDHKNLTIHERLVLLIKVCGAIQDAHQKGIIHRDLKPANILVVEVGGVPVPRLIDFGLARTTGPAATGASVFTGVWGIAGTPGYISPEQVTGADIDTRTDVYALGVILYELLTGSRPFDTESWRGQPFDEVLRRLREEDPPRPSTRLSNEKALSASAAQVRATEPKHLAGLLRGDLDCIAMKALEKDRSQRYGTPSELAADVLRYLHHEPVLARPATARYRLSKYVRRHRAAVGVAALLFILLAGFAAVEAAQLRRITRERDRADRIADFMTGMFKISDPSAARGNSVTAREILDRASADIGAGLAKDPELQAQMMYVMGTVYDDLGLYSRAVSLLTRSSAIGPSDGASALHARAALGKALYHAGQYAQAVDELRATLADDLRVYGPKSRDTTAVMEELAYALQWQGGHYAEAESLLRRAISIDRPLFGPDDPDTLHSLSDLGLILNIEGKRSEAETLLREVLARRTRALGPQDVDTIRSVLDLGTILVYEGKYPEAESRFRQVLDWQTRVLGPNHADTMATVNDLAVVLRHEGRLAESATLQEGALDFYRRVLGPENPKTFLVLNNLAETRAQMGEYANAEQMLREARQIQLRVLPNDAETAITTYNLAGVYALEGRRDEALSLARDSVDRGLPPGAGAAIASDPDFKSLVGDPRFVALAAYAGEKAAAAQRPPPTPLPGVGHPH